MTPELFLELQKSLTIKAVVKEDNDFPGLDGVLIITLSLDGKEISKTKTALFATSN